MNHQSDIFFFKSQFGGLLSVAREIGLGEELDIRIGRLDIHYNRYSMNTDAQVELKMPLIRGGTDKLQGIKGSIFEKKLNMCKPLTIACQYPSLIILFYPTVLVYPVEIIFSQKKAHIVIEVSGESSMYQMKQTK